MHCFFATRKKESGVSVFLTIAVVALLSFGLAGCAGRRGQTAKMLPLVPEDQEAKNLTPAPDRSLVYLYRGDLEIPWKLAVELDGASSLTEEHGYLVWEVEPGKHTFKTHLHKVITIATYRFKIETEGGQRYYYTLHRENARETTLSSSGPVTYDVQKVSEEVGRKNIEASSLLAWFRNGDVVFQRELDPTAKPKPEASQAEAAAEPAPEATPVPEVKAEPVPEAESGSEVAVAEEENAEERAPIVQGAYYALVVGISDYEHLNALPNATHDALAVADALRGYGFEVSTLLDREATRAQILESLDAFQRTLTPEDRLLVYYAGHSQFGTDGQIVYWQPVEAKEESMAQWIVVDTVTAALKQIPAVQVLVVADSLYSGTFAQASQVSAQDAEERRQYLERSAAKPARVILTGGSAHPSPATAGDGVSLFANAFIEGLAEMKKIGREAFTAEELFQGYMLAIVAGQSEHMPAFQAIRNSGHGGGDFVFTTGLP